MLNDKSRQTDRQEDRRMNRKTVKHMEYLLVYDKASYFWNQQDKCTGTCTEKALRALC